MRKLHKNKLLNCILIILFLLAILSFFISYTFDANFVEKYIDEDNRIGEHVKPRVEIFQKQMLCLSVFFGFAGLLLLTFKKNTLNYLNKNPKFLTNILLLLLIMVILFSLGEILSRTLFSERIYKEYTNGPGAAEYLSKIKYNSLGYRDTEHDITKPQDTYRILFLGDSLTFGFGIENFEATYPELIQNELNKKNNPKKAETIILAKRGYSTLDELKALKETGLKYDPDLIIVGYFLNDAEGYGSRTGYENMFYSHYTIPYELGSILYRHSFFYYFLESRIKNIITNLGFGKNNIDYTKHLYSNSNPYFQQHKKDLEEIIHISNERKIPVIITVIPPLENLKEYPYTEIHTQIKGISEPNGAYFLDLLPYFKLYDPAEVRVSLMDAHMNELGHKITSDAIIAYLQEKQLL